MTLLHLTIAGFALSIGYVGWMLWRAPLLDADECPFVGENVEPGE